MRLYKASVTWCAIMKRTSTPSAANETSEMTAEIYAPVGDGAEVQSGDAEIFYYGELPDFPCSTQLPSKSNCSHNVTSHAVP